MGVFDTVYLDCPECGKVIEEQSKWGDPMFNTIDLRKDHSSLYWESILGMNRCYHCDKYFMVEQVQAPRYVARKCTKDESDE